MTRLNIYGSAISQDLLILLPSCDASKASNIQNNVASRSILLFVARLSL